MRLRQRLLVCLLATPALLAAQSAPLKAIQGELDRLYPTLDALYLDLHEHPELAPGP